MRRLALAIFSLGLAGAVVGCGGDANTADGSSTAAPPTAATTLPASTVPVTTVPVTTVPVTTVPATTTTSPPATAPTTTVPSAVLESRVIGASVQGRPIVADRLGTPGGRVVLAVGVIHGNENKGLEITTLLRTMDIPAGIDLWIIDTVNPDGLAANTRQNANYVDLNRNFSHNWGYIPIADTNGQYSGEAPADQPETQAVEAFIREIQPEITAWWHQDANRVSVGGARRELPREFARLVDLTTASTPCTQGCTGTASQFTNANVVGGTAFIVELPGSDVVDEAMVRRHAESFLTIIQL